MTTNGVFKATLLGLVALCAIALWMNSTGKSDHLDVVMSSGQFERLIKQIDRVEEVLRARGGADNEETHAAVAQASGVRRTEERGDDVTAVLQEIRDSVRALASDYGKFAAADTDGVPKNTQSISKALQGDTVTEGTLLHRHFCWTRAQVYSTYGFPDGRGEGGGVCEWTYRDEGSGHWLQFQFTDGIVSNVRIGQLSGR